MAYEYTWYGDAELDTSGLRAFIAATTGGEEHPDGTVFLAGMYVTARSVAGDDVNPAVRLFGFEHRFHVVLDAEWEDWTENGEIAPLLDQFATEVLPQPLL